MANIFEMMRQAGSLKKNLKDVQKQLAAKTVECDAGGGKIKVVARGDMTIKSIEIDPELPASVKPDKLGALIAEAVNGALAKAKKEAGASLSGLAGGLDVGGLLRDIGMG